MNPSSSKQLTRGAATHRVHRLVRFLSSLAVALVVLAAPLARASDTHVQYAGFVSQGYLFSHGNNIFGETKGNGSFDFREMAANASATFGPKLRVGAQIFAETLGKYGKDKAVIDWAVADYNVRQEFGVRVGRIKLARGLYNEALDLDATRPFILLPSSLYDSRLRDFQAAINGAMAYGSVDTRLGNFDYKAYYGGTRLPKDSGVEDMLTRADIVNKLRVKAIYGASLFWSGPINGLRAGLTYLRQERFEYAGLTWSTRTLAYRASADEFSNHNYIGSVEYTRGDWTFASEWEVRSTADLLTNLKHTGSNFYVSAARRLNAQWEAGAYWSGSRRTRGMSVSSSSSYRRLDEYVTSIKFNPIDRLSFKLEAHAIDGTASVLDVEGSRNPRAGRKEKWYLFAAKTTLTF